MTPNGLRIGNWVNATTKHASKNDKVKTGTVNSISSHCIMIGNVGAQNGRAYRPELISPIPLTEEWWLRLGFSKWSDGKFRLDNGVHTWRINGMRVERINNGSGSSGKPMFIVNAVHVHQFQNIYFALTGEELEIKDK